MDNKTVARIFNETADLMQVRAEDSFRIRSYQRAAEALESLPQQVSEIYKNEKALLAIPGIGKGMAANIVELCTTGKLALHEELLHQYDHGALRPLQIH